MREGPDFRPFEDGHKKLVVLCSEAPFFVLLHAECLDNPVPGDGLMEERGDGPHLFLASPAEFAKPLPELFDGDNGQRKDDQRNDGQLPILVEDDTDQGDDGENILQKTRDDIGDRSLDEVDVIGDSGDKDPRGGLGKEREGERL